MMSYISRRRRWYRMMLELDPTLTLTQDILGDQLLENSGLSKTEKLMILTSTWNSTDFEKVATANIHREDLELHNPRLMVANKAANTAAKAGAEARESTDPASQA